MRGKRRCINELIANINVQIETAEDKIKSLKEQRNQLLKKKKDADLSKVLNLMEEKNISIEQLETMLVEDTKVKSK